MKTLRAVRRAFPFCALVCVSPVCGQTWTQTSAPETNWTAIACSADGTKLVAAATGIYRSTNSGATWSGIAPGTEWQTWVIVAGSADGTTLLAAGRGGVYTSTDSGATWAPSGALGSPFTGAACSADGSRMAVTSMTEMHGGGAINTSTNSGTSWVTDPGGYWVGVGCSADGLRLVAVQRNFLLGPIPLSLSPDFGLTWTSGPSDYWSESCLACSAEGRKIFAGALEALHLSLDSGMTWSAISGFGMRALACSADGSRVIGLHGSVYTSADSGATWVSNAVPALPWSAVASSADGHRMFAAVNGGGIYTLQTTPAPVLNITPPGNNFILSWIVPSISFVLQESPDMTAWSDIEATPALNYTNLQYEVRLARPTSPRFYRLATRHPGG